MRRVPDMTVATFALAVLPTIAACDPPTIVQASHVQANAPADAEFNRLLQRDLNAYFSASGISNARTEFDSLRRGATQSGAAYPKYYLWVRVHSGPSVEAEGAVRVAAVDGERFEITNFLSKADIRANPDRVGGVFPASLVAGIQERAAAE